MAKRRRLVTPIPVTSAPTVAPAARLDEAPGVGEGERPELDSEAKVDGFLLEARPLKVLRKEGLVAVLQSDGRLLVLRGQERLYHGLVPGKPAQLQAMRIKEGQKEAGDREDAAALEVMINGNWLRRTRAGWEHTGQKERHDLRTTSDPVFPFAFVCRYLSRP